ncbi:MAG TPA: 23S rRNA (guanosine(2251)-2'-O)-methyltransferase RlmB [Ilumatobacter sp.]|nr:23S rRNA (guanosine(2251)-2'-O)-methyltransferase RlmB [Ilumatobacter sp.]
MSGRSPKRSAGQGRGGRAAAGRRSGPPRSRGAGRTGKVRPGDDAPKRRSDKGLGGEQVEGRQAVRELLLAQRRKVHEIWIAADLQDTDAVDDIVAIASANRVPIAWVARKKLDAAARTEAPQGVLALAAPIPEADLARYLRRRGDRSPFLVAVDGVTDPGNLGAIVRSCDGAGVDVVVVPRHRAVHVTPTVAKASAGAVEHVPIALVAGLPSALQRMRDAGIWVVGLDDAADRSLFEIDDLAVEGVCMVLGAEGAGLSRLVRERCDMIVSIPMLGRLSSLNVSAAAALATYEISRHRRTVPIPSNDF